MENESHPLIREPVQVAPPAVRPRTYLQRGDGYGPDYPSGLDTHKIGAFFRRRRWPILGGFLFVMAAVTALTFLLPKTYESTASFLVEQEGARTDLPALAVLERIGRLAGRETEVELIQSRRVVEPVVDARDLHVSVETPEGPKRPSEIFAWFEAGSDAEEGRYELSQRADGRYSIRDAETGETLATAEPDAPLNFAGVTATMPRVGTDVGGPYRVDIIPFAKAVEKTQKRIEAKPVRRKADLVVLTCEARTAAGARWLCSAISQSYLSLRSDLQEAEAVAAAEFLADQADIVKHRLTAAEDSLWTFKRRVQAVALDTRASEEVRQNAALWAQREQLRAERVALSALITQSESDDGGSRRYRNLASFPTFLKSQNNIVTALVENLVTVENRRNDLAVRRSGKDVELAGLDERIADIERQLRSIAMGYEQALAAQIASLGQALRNSGVVLAAIPSQQIKIARLERQVSLFDALYGFLQMRLQEAEIAQSVELPSVRVVDGASLPFEPSSPNVPLNLAVGFLLASGLGLMLGLWKESTDTRVREREGLEEEMGIPVLSMIPALKRPSPVISVSLAAANGHEAVTLAPKWTPERRLLLEAFRTLSTDLSFVAQQLLNGGMCSMVVTSAGRGEGKTLTACNLAIARASHGARTLLIDGDLRARGVSHFLQLPLDLPGLTELVTSDTEASSVIRKMKVGAGHTLWVLPAGAPTSRSAELLESEQFRQFLQKVEKWFDVVVIDTPPLNVVTDAAVVAAQVDGVIVVVRGGVTDRAALNLTLVRLERAGARTAGIVLNDVDLPVHYRTYSHEA